LPASRAHARHHTSNPQLVRRPFGTSLCSGTTIPSLIGAEAMSTTTRTRRSQRRLATGWAATVLSLSLVLTGCTDGGGTESSGGVTGSAPPRVYDQAAHSAFVAELAGVGVGVYPVGSAEPVVTPAAPVSAVRLTTQQAETAGLGGFEHAGIRGRDLDELVPAEPMMAGYDPIPSSLLVAAWSQTATSGPAALAKRLLGEQNWSNYGDIVFPLAVLTLFVADVVTPGNFAPVEAVSPDAGPDLVVRPAAAVSTCEQVKGFIGDAIGRVFDVIGYVKVSVVRGSFLERALIFIGNLGAVALNLGIDALHTIVVEGTELALSPVVNAITSIASLIAVVTQVVLFLSPWVATIRPVPGIVTRGESTQPGLFRVEVSNGIGVPDHWPPEIEGCARAANVTLPNLKPQGAPVTWTLGPQTPLAAAPHVTRVKESTTLNADGAATLDFVSVPEPPDVAANDEVLYDGHVDVTVALHRNDLDELHTVITAEILSLVPPLVARFFGKAIRDVLDPRLKSLLAPLTRLRDQSVRGFLAVNYHAKPTPTPTPVPSTKPTRARIPEDCPSGAKVGHGATSAGVQRAPEGTACAYVVPGERCILGIGLIPVVPDHPSKRPGYRSVQIPGLGEAWYGTGSCQGSGFDLEIVIGTQGMTVTADTLEKAIDIARRVLGLT